MRYRFVRRRWHVLFALVDRIGGAAARLWRSSRADAAPLGETPRVLVVQLDHLGDAVLSTGLLRGLRARWPRATIDVLCAPWNREVFAACGAVDGVKVSQINRFSPRRRPHWPLAMLRWGWRLRQPRYDLAIDPRGEFAHAVLMWLAAARRRVGWDCGGGGFLLTDSPPYVPGRHQVRSRQAVLDVLGIAPPRGEACWAPAVRPSPQAVRAVAARLAAAGIDPRAQRRVQPLVVVHVGAGTPAKRWPVEHWRELVGRLVVEQSAQVVLVGSAADRATAAAVLGTRPWPCVLDWTGALSIDELAGLLSLGDAMVGADSGPAHLAAAVGTAVVVPFAGANDARTWRPWGERAVVLRQPAPCAPCYLAACPLRGHPCMGGLAPRRVAQAVAGVLAGRAARRPSPTAPLETAR